MWMAGQRLNQKLKQLKYVILGDDVLVGDPLLYREYRKLLSLLDMPVSEQKTHESKTLCEFAKRWIYKGEEITPFPLPAVLEAKGNYFQWIPLLLAETNKGYSVKCDKPLAFRK